jgi:integrase
VRNFSNYGKKRELVDRNPIDGIDFFPMEKRIKAVPSSRDIDKVIAAANPETQDYLWVIRETMGRVSEINRLEWKDVDLNERYVVLYTRKKKGGHLTPRKIPMSLKLYEVLSRQYLKRDSSKPWVFWHEYVSSKTGERCSGPYKDRKRFMSTLCKKASVTYFRFHALRHSGASLMENNNVPIGSIQRILGHQNRSTNEIYLHSSRESERLAIDQYERAREKSHTDSHTKEKGL